MVAYIGPYQMWPDPKGQRSNTKDTCHEKIDLFGVQNIAIHELLCWMRFQAHKPAKYFSDWLSNSWLFCYQIYCSSSSRNNFMQIWRPKNCQYFEPWRGLFSRDTCQRWSRAQILYADLWFLHCNPSTMDLLPRTLLRHHSCEECLVRHDNSEFPIPSLI